MNKKNISMMAMISCIVFTVIYFLKFLFEIPSFSEMIYYWGTLSVLWYVLKFLSGAAFNVFWILFFRSNYMEKDDRKISLFAGISAFVAAFFHVIWAASWTWYSLIAYYIPLCFIALGIFLIFNYLGKSKKIISLVLAIMSGLSLILGLRELFLYFFLDGNTLLFLKNFETLAFLFVTIIEILFFIIIYRSYPKVDKDKEENLSVGDWMLMIFLTAIPIVGLVMLLIWAFENNPHPIKSSWAKANLIWGLIIIGLSIIATLIILLSI